ncbi:SOS response-associated peptidase [Paenibacillus wenxiniae]|uniref:Abasic site processing protein n=1 Tax=Paenibacillus wenxiniae TaxID=1636843 RepID=A0ABW4RFG3_9BACL
MCGMYSLMSDLDAVTSAFKLHRLAIDAYAPCANIAPAQDVPVIRSDEDGQRMLEAYRWGLVPSYSNDIGIGSYMINARAETLDSKPTFQRLLPSRRIGIVADGFYEWKKENQQNQQNQLYCFRLRSGEPFVFAGLYDEWESPEDGRVIRSCTIITTTSNELVAPIHDRMPVILDEPHLSSWLQPKPLQMELKEILVPLAADRMYRYPVDDASEYVSNNAPIG